MRDFLSVSLCLVQLHPMSPWPTPGQAPEHVGCLKHLEKSIHCSKSIIFSLNSQCCILNQWDNQSMGFFPLWGQNLIGKVKGVSPEDEVSKNEYYSIVFTLIDCVMLLLPPVTFLGNK